MKGLRWFRRLRRFRRLATLVLVSLLLCAGLLHMAIVMIPLPERLAPPISQTVTYQDGRLAHVFLADDGRWRIDADHTAVDPAYIEALLALEDKRFYSHPGIDVIAIARAALSNVTRGRVVSGASTITMQVVRMAEPRPRTLRSKAVEAFRAVQLERHHTKEEILDMYLRLLPYGKNYEGLETATRVYFGQDASRLTPDQIALLLAVPMAPSSRYPSPQNEERLRRARDEIAGRLLASGALPRGHRSESLTDEEALIAIAAAPVPTGYLAMPREIPHMAYQLRARYPDTPEITSAIDRSVQRVAERMVSHHQENIAELGGANAAVVVMDHQTGELVAAVGSFGYFEGGPGRQIPAYDVRRSTGSLLKPFLLARAIDLGEAAPTHRVADVPVDYGGYSPENFDGNFDGLVRLDDALARSLNVPFVNLLNTTGVNDFQGVLARLGMSVAEETVDHRGLSLVVGGVEASPVEIATMYSALAREGDPVAARRLGGSGRPVPTGLNRPLTAESSHLVREILQRRERPDFARRGLIRGGSQFAWKTGTSMGFRDAWTAGFGPRYVVVAWTGNLDHRPGRYLVGERAAAPLFFDVIEAIDGARAPYRPPPEGLTTVEVCAFSGHLPTAACDHTTHVDLPSKSVATRPCPYHSHVDVDVETGEATTRACQGDREVETRAFLDLPGDVLAFYSPVSSELDLTPPPAPGCRAVHRPGRGPRIASPPAETIIALIPGMPPDAQQIPLEATQEGSGELRWFLNGRFLATVRPGERLWWQPEVGSHEFVVTDRQGRSQRRSVVVR